MRRRVVLVAVLVALTACVQCSHLKSEKNVLGDTEGKAAVPEAASTVDQIIDKYVEAIGGPGAARGVTSIQAKGTFELPEMKITGSLEFYAKVPNKSGTIVRTPDDSIFVIQAFDGAIGWERSLKSEEGRIAVRQIKGAELNQIRLDSDFHREFKLKEIYPRMSLKGRVKVDDRDANVIEAVPSAGSPETLYFDAQTGLLVRRDMTAYIPTGETPSEVYFDDYKPVTGATGLKIAYTRTIIFPEGTEGNTILRFKEARANVQLNDSTFSMPRQ
jgi:hypothetical protein